MGFQNGIDREQTMLFPVSLEDMIPKEHPIRILDLFIQKLDLQSPGFIASMVAAEDRPAYDPKDLLKPCFRTISGLEMLWV